jgi:hypothetical protein
MQNPLSLMTLCLTFGVLVPRAAAQVLSAPAPDWGVQLGTSQSDRCRGACSDGQGGLWITGSTAVIIGFNWRTFVLHLDSAGAVQHQTFIDGNGIDHAHAVAPDGMGGVFVCGQTNSPLVGPIVGGGYDGFLARVDAQGNVLWIRQLGTTASDVASKVAPDGAGGVFVGGGDSTVGVQDAFVAHFDALGTELWTWEFDSGGSDIFGDVVAAPGGGVFVAGASNGSPGTTAPNGANLFVAKLDVNGATVWITREGGVGSDVGTSIVLDAAGDLWVAGSSASGFFGPAHGLDDMFLSRRSAATGLPFGSWTYGTADHDGVLDLAVDANGDLILAGARQVVPNADAAVLLHLAPDGTVRWQLEYGGAGQDFAAALVPMASGGIFVAGTASDAVAGPHLGSTDAVVFAFPASCRDNLSCRFGRTACADQAPFGHLTATGSPFVVDGALTVRVEGLVAGAYGSILCSDGPTYRPLGGVAGALCLGGSPGRILGPGGTVLTSNAGSIEVALDLTQLPLGAGTVAAMPGDTFHFQAWLRPGPAPTTSTLSEALAVTFW